ncbi:MAG: hypothetical protein ABI779_19155 [Acidobacteriota bacterium]
MNLRRAMAVALEKRRKHAWGREHNELAISREDAREIVQLWEQRHVIIEVWLIARHAPIPAARLRGAIRDLTHLLGERRTTFYESAQKSLIVIADTFIEDAMEITNNPSEAGSRLTFYYPRWVLRLSDHGDHERAAPS